MHPNFDEITDSGVYGPYGPNDPDLPIVAVYARVSSDDQVTEGHSIPTQIVRSLEAAERRLGKGKFRYVIYVDCGLSGAVPPLLPGSGGSGRPGLGRMMADAEAGMLAVALFSHQDRLSRDIVDSHQVAQFLAKHVSFVCFVEQNLDWSSPDCETVFGINAVLSSRERKRIAERVTAGIWKRRQDGYWTGNPPYGWRREGKENLPARARPNIIRVEEEAKVIRQVYDWVLSGWGDWKIVVELKDRGIASPYGKGEWSPRTLRTNLRTPCHAGLIRIDGKLVEAAHFDQRIVEPDEYYRVQEILDSRKRIGSNTKSCKNHLIADLAVCGACGRRIYIHGTSTKPSVKHYRCFGKKPHHPEICSGWTCKQSRVEAVLLGRIRRLAESKQVQEKASEEVEAMLSLRKRELAGKIKSVERELADLPSKKEDLLRAYMRSSLSADLLVEKERQFEAMRTELAEQLSALQSELAGAEDMRRQAQACRQALSSFNTVWDALDVEQQRHLLKSLVELLTIERRDRNTVVMRLKLLFGEEETIVIHPEKRPTKVKTGVDSLTQCQLGVLYLIQQGLTYKEIAERRGVTVQCVHSTASAARRQLGVTTNKEAIDLAVPRIEAECELLPLDGRRRP